MNKVRNDSRIKVKKNKRVEYLVDGLFFCSLDPSKIERAHLKDKDYWKGKKKFPRACNYKLFLDPKNHVTADHCVQCIFPDDVEISAVDKNEDMEDFING